MSTVPLLHRGPSRLMASLSLALLAPLGAGASLPSAAPAQPPAGTTAAATATTPAPAKATRASWTSDRREFTVGDLVTVLIDDYTISTALKENSASDTRVARPVGHRAAGPATPRASASTRQQ